MNLWLNVLTPFKILNCQNFYPTQGIFPGAACCYLRQGNQDTHRTMWNLHPVSPSFDEAHLEGGAGGGLPICLGLGILAGGQLHQQGSAGLDSVELAALRGGDMFYDPTGRDCPDFCQPLRFPGFVILNPFPACCPMLLPFCLSQLDCPPEPWLSICSRGTERYITLTMKSVDGFVPEPSHGESSQVSQHPKPRSFRGGDDLAFSRSNQSLQLRHATWPHDFQRFMCDVAPGSERRGRSRHNILSIVTAASGYWNGRLPVSSHAPLLWRSLPSPA